MAPPPPWFLRLWCYNSLHVMHMLVLNVTSTNNITNPMVCYPQWGASYPTALILHGEQIKIPVLNQYIVERTRLVVTLLISLSVNPIKHLPKIQFCHGVNVSSYNNKLIGQRLFEMYISH